MRNSFVGRQAHAQARGRKKAGSTGSSARETRERTGEFEGGAVLVAQNGLVDVIDQLIAHWESQPGIALRRGATDRMLRAFEERYGVTLPIDLRGSLQRANGAFSADEYLTAFYGLDQMMPAGVPWNGAGQIPSLFLIGDAMIDCPVYAICLRGEHRGAVFELNGERDNPMPQVASSYSRFIAMYLVDPESLGLGLSGYTEQRADRPYLTLDRFASDPNAEQQHACPLS